MNIWMIILCVALGLSIALNLALWTTDKELKEELEFNYGEQSTNN